MNRRLGIVLAAALAGCSAGSSEPSVRLDVTRTGSSAVVHATVEGLGSPSFFWTLADPQTGELTASGPDATFVARDDLSSNVDVGVNLSVTGADADNLNVRLVAATFLESIGGFHPTDDLYNVVEGERLIVSAPGVLMNDANGQGVTAQLVNGPEHGTLVLQPDGSFTYDFAGSDYFFSPDSATYAVVTSSGYTETRTITFAIGYFPRLQDDAFQVVADTAFTASHLINDMDRDAYDEGFTRIDTWADGKTVIATQPQHGVLSLQPYGEFTYAPAPSFTGEDSFAYTITNSAGLSSTATVALVVRSLADAWVASSGQLACPALPCSLPLMVDAKGYTMTYRRVPQPYSGGLFHKPNPDGSLSEEPVSFSNAPGEPMIVWLVAGPPGAPGINSFDFIVNDGTYDSPVMRISADISD